MSYPFVLPIGLLTSDGKYHRDGVMRPATAIDEIEPMGDERVKRNEAYYGLLLLARVVTRLGRFSPVTVDILSLLPAQDFAYLQDLYASLNTASSGITLMSEVRGGLSVSHDIAAPHLIETDCPHCGATLELNLQEAH